MRRAPCWTSPGCARWDLLWAVPWVAEGGEAWARLRKTLMLADGLVRHPPEAAGASVLPLAHIDGDGLVGWIDAPAALRTGTMDLLLLTLEQAVPYLLGTPDKALCFLVPAGGGQHPCAFLAPLPLLRPHLPAMLAKADQGQSWRDVTAGLLQEGLSVAYVPLAA